MTWINKQSKTKNHAKLEAAWNLIFQETLINVQYCKWVE